MAAIRPADQIARKWANVTPARAADYEAGVKEPMKDWARNTGAAAESYKTGVTQAIADKRFEKGVSRVGTAGWQKGAVEKGVPRWGAGVALAEPAYLAGFAPYREAIARTTLPPRYARRDPRNLARVASVVNAMIAVKTGKA